MQGLPQMRGNDDVQIRLVAAGKFVGSRKKRPSAEAAPDHVHTQTRTSSFTLAKASRSSFDAPGATDVPPTNTETAKTAPEPSNTATEPAAFRTDHLDGTNKLSGVDQHQAVADLAKVGTVRSGYLLKHGGGRSCLGRKNWKRRLFVLRQGYLSYHVAPEMAPLGTIQLVADTGLELSLFKNTKRMLSIVTPLRTYHCISDTSQDAHEWLEALRAARPSLAATEHKRAGATSYEQLVLHMDRVPGEPFGLKLATADDAGTTIHVIREVAHGSTAAIAGIERLDILLEINGHMLTGLTHEEATKTLHVMAGYLQLKIGRKCRTDKHGSNNRLLAGLPGDDLEASGHGAVALSQDRLPGSSAISATTDTAAATPPPPEPLANTAAATPPPPEPRAIHECSQGEERQPSDAGQRGAGSQPDSPIEGTQDSEQEEARAERLRQMREKRLERKSSKVMELLEVLSIIDNLDEG